MKIDILREIFESKGCYTNLRISKNELYLIYSIIKKNILSSVRKYNPESFKKIKTIKLGNYHKFSKNLNHKDICSKKSRNMIPKDVAKIKKLHFFKKLKNIFETSKLASAAGVFKEEIDWRLTRPKYKTDIGPLHADAWFWELNDNFKSGKKYERVKCWIPIVCEKGKNGLRYIPGSHKKKFRYSSIKKDGMIKPHTILYEKKYKKVLFKTDPGQLVIFNDRLIHGGKPGGKNSRIAIEFTMLVNKKKLKQNNISFS